MRRYDRRVTTFRPHPGLRGRVASIDVVESADAELTVLPSTGAVLGFQFRGRVRAQEALLSTAGVTGIQQGARRYAYLGETASILVRFTPQGAACLGVPVSELTGKSLPLDDLLPPGRVREARARLLEARATSDRVAAVERLLLGLPFAADPLIARGLELIEERSGGDSIVASMARALAISERQLERRFLQRVGLTPKRFAALRRFERATAMAEGAPSLTDAALAAGYYDQSHFIREFRRFTGSAPGELLRRRG